jgi:hypothetical protein
MYVYTPSFRVRRRRRRRRGRWRWGRRQQQEIKREERGGKNRRSDDVRMEVDHMRCMWIVVEDAAWKDRQGRSNPNNPNNPKQTRTTQTTPPRMILEPRNRSCMTVWRYGYMDPFTVIVVVISQIPLFRFVPYAYPYYAFHMFRSLACFVVSRFVSHIP